MVKEQLGHQSPLGAFGNLGQSTLVRSDIFLQRRTLGSQSLSILNLKAFYPNGFPTASTEIGHLETGHLETDSVKTDSAKINSVKAPGARAPIAETSDTDNISHTRTTQSTDESHSAHTSSSQIQRKQQDSSPLTSLNQDSAATADTISNQFKRANNLPTEQKKPGSTSSPIKKQQVAPLRADIQRYFSPTEYQKSESPVKNAEPSADKIQPLFNQNQAIQAKSDKAKVDPSNQTKGDQTPVGSTSTNHVSSTSSPVSINSSAISSASAAIAQSDDSTHTIARKVAQKAPSVSSAAQNSASSNDSTHLDVGAVRPEGTTPHNNTSIQRSTQTSLDSTVRPPSQNTDRIQESTHVKRKPLDSAIQKIQNATSRIENSSGDVIDVDAVDIIASSSATNSLQRSSERPQRESVSTSAPLDEKANLDQKNSLEASTKETSAVASSDASNKITSQLSSIQRSAVESASESVSSTASLPLESTDRTPSAIAQPAIDSAQNNTASIHQPSHDVASINVTQSLQSLRAPLNQPSQSTTSVNRTLQPKRESSSSDNSLSVNLASSESITPADSDTLQLKAKNRASTSLDPLISASSADNQTEKTLSEQSSDTTDSIQLKAEASQTNSATANTHSEVTASIPTENIASISIAASDANGDSTIQRASDTDIAQQSADVAFHQKTSEQLSTPETIQKKSSAPFTSVSQEVNEALPTQFSNAVSAKVSSTEGAQSIAEHPIVQAKGETHDAQLAKPNHQIQRVFSTKLSASNTSSPVPSTNRSQQTSQSAEQLIQRMSDRTQKPELTTQPTAADIPYTQPKTPSLAESEDTTTPLIQTKPVAHTQQTINTKAAFAKTFSASENTDLAQNEDTIQKSEEDSIHSTLPPQQPIPSQPRTTESAEPSLNHSNESIQRQTISSEMPPAIETSQQSSALDAPLPLAKEKLSDSQSFLSSSSLSNSDGISIGKTAEIAQPTSIARSHTNINQPIHSDIQRSTTQPADETASSTIQQKLDTNQITRPSQTTPEDIQRQETSGSIGAEATGGMKTNHSVDRSDSVDAIAPSSSLPESQKTTDTAIQRSLVSEIPSPITEGISQKPTNIIQATAAPTDGVIQTTAFQQQSSEALPASQSTNAKSSEQIATSITETVTSMPLSDVTSQQKVDMAVIEAVNVDQQAQAAEHGTIQRAPELTETTPLHESLEPNITAASKIIQRQTASSINNDNITASSANMPTNYFTNQAPIESTAAELISTTPQEISQQTSPYSASIQKQTDHSLVSEKAEPHKGNPERLSNSPLNTAVPNIQAISAPEIITPNTQAIQRETEHAQATHTNSNAPKSNTSDSNSSEATNSLDSGHSALNLSSSNTVQTKSDIIQTKVDNHQNKPTTTTNTQLAASNTIQRLAESNEPLIQPDSVPTHRSVSTQRSVEKPTEKPTEKPLELLIQRSTDHLLSIKEESKTSVTEQSQRQTAAEQHINETSIQRQLDGTSTLATSKSEPLVPSVKNTAEQTSSNNAQPHKTPSLNSPEDTQLEPSLQRKPETLDTSIANLAAIDTSVAQPTLSSKSITAQRQIENNAASDSLSHSSAIETSQFPTEASSTETSFETSPSYTAKTLIQRMTVDSQISANEVHRAETTPFSPSSTKKSMVQKKDAADDVLTSNISQRDHHTPYALKPPEKNLTKYDHASSDTTTKQQSTPQSSTHAAIQRASDTPAEYTKQHTESSNTIQSIQDGDSITASKEDIAQPTLQASASITEVQQPANTFADIVQRKSEQRKSEQRKSADNSPSQSSQEKSEEQLSASSTSLSDSEASQPSSDSTPPSPELSSAIRRKDEPAIALSLQHTLSTEPSQTIQTKPFAAASSLPEQIDRQISSSAISPDTASLNNLQHADNPIQRQAAAQTAKPNQSQPVDNATSQQWSNLEDLVTQLSEDTATPQQTLQAKHDRQQSKTSKNIEDIAQQKPIDERIPSEWSNLEGLVNNLLGEAPSPASSNTSIQKKGINQQSSQAETSNTSSPVVTPQQLSSSSFHQPQAQPTLIQASPDDTPTITIMRAQDDPPPTDSKQYSKYLELLAQEVYGLLRQRLTLEQERRGPKYPR